MKSIEYDIFLSHASKDKAVVSKLYNQLWKRLSVFMDSYSIGHGEHFPIRIEEALKNSRYIVACYTPDYFESDWVKKELHTCLATNPLNRNGKILPILLKKCDIPDFYSSYKYIDFTDDYNNKIEELIRFVLNKEPQKWLPQKGKIGEKKLKKIAANGTGQLVEVVEYMEKDIIGLVPEDEFYSVIFFDIDNFTMINIVHGGIIGNCIIQEFNKLSLGPTIIIKHWRADEFCIVCPKCQEPDAIKISHKLMKWVKKRNWEKIIPGLYVSISIGYATSGKKDGEYSRFLYTLERAIIGCKRAKREGKGIIWPGPTYIKSIQSPREEKPIPIWSTINFIISEYSS